MLVLPIDGTRTLLVLAPPALQFKDKANGIAATDRETGAPLVDVPVALTVEGGTPLFQFGPIGYTLLTDATAAPSASPSEVTAPSAGASPSPTGGTGSPTSGTGSNTGLLLILGAVVVAAVAGTLAVRRRGAKATEEE